MSHVRIDIERAHVFKRCMERADERDQIPRMWKEIHDPLLVHVTASIMWIMCKARKDRLVVEPRGKRTAYVVAMALWICPNIGLGRVVMFCAVRYT
jgi:hypothetical protein